MRAYIHSILNVTRVQSWGLTGAASVGGGHRQRFSTAAGCRSLGGLTKQPKQPWVPAELRLQPSVELNPLPDSRVYSSR